jgi:hypothetical protein
MTRQNKKANVTGRTLGWKVIFQAAQNAQAAGENDKAEELFERVLSVVEKRLPPDDLRTACVLLDISDFYLSVQKLSEGESCFKKAQAIMRMHADKLERDEPVHNLS